MKKANVLELLDWYRKLSPYGPYRLQNEEQAVKLPYAMTEREFFEKLYIPTKLENELYKEINSLTNGNIIALCGPSGSGKSTVSFKVKTEIERQLRSKVMFIDMRLAESSKYFDSIEVINDQHVRNLLLNQFLKDYPIPIQGKDVSERYDLYYYLLTPEFDNEKDTQTFHPLQKTIAKVIHLFNKVYKRDISFKNWFYDNLTNVDLINIFLELDEQIDVPHYISYIKHTDKFDIIIFWLDNIDAFTNLQQSQIVEIIEKLQRSVLNATKTVISVREENIYRIGKFTDNYNEPYISRVTFKNPDEDSHSYTDYGAINVPVMSFRDLLKLVTNKLNFSYDKFKKYGDKLNYRLNRIEEDITDLRRNNIPKYNLNREQIVRQKKELMSDIENQKMFPVMEQDFNKIVQMSNKICECFNNEKIIFLANNSIKNYLRIHSEFLYYLVERCINEEGIIDVDKYNLSQITTIFLSWIHTVNEAFGVETFNVFEELGKHQLSERVDNMGCFLPYLILTRIWNDCIHLNGRPSPENNPYVHKVINDLNKDFGFKKKHVRKALFGLYKQVGGKGNFITFRTKKIISSPNELDTSTTVRVTYRGRVTIGHITNSYGYLKECTERLRTLSEKDIPIEELILKKLCEITEVHLISLKMIRDRRYEKNVNWFYNYISVYGIPLEPSFVRNYSTGKELKNTKFNRCLYLESVFESLGGYFHLHLNVKYKESLELLINQFNFLLNKLINNEEVEQIKIDLL